MPPEDNSADDVQPTREEWEAYEAERKVKCPLCGKLVNITSWTDDTRWRYSAHADCGPDGENCDSTDELIHKGAADAAR